MNIIILFTGKKLGDSTSRVCNAMVHNPIYDGPVYESVQQQFNTLTVTTLQTSSVSDTSADHPCNCSPPSTPTPTHSEKSARYVDPPAQFHISKLRSKSVISHCSAPSGVIDTGNIPRSTSVSVPVIKKTPKQRNKLNLTLPLAGTESGNTNTTGCLMSTSGPILTDVDENYTTMMSPASALIGTAKCSELN